MTHAGISSDYDQKKSALLTARCIGAILWKFVGPAKLLLIITTTVLSGAMPVCGIYAGKLVVDALVMLLQAREGAMTYSPLVLALGVQLLATVLGRWINQVQAYVVSVAGQNLALAMNADILNGVVSLDYAHFDNPDFYDMMTRAQRQTGSRPLLVLLRLTTVIRSAVTLASMMGLFLRLNWVLCIVMFGMSAPALFLQIRYGRQRYRLERSRTQEKRLGDYLSGLIINRSARPELMSLGLFPYLLNRWYAIASKCRHQDIRLLQRQSLVQFIVEPCMTAGQIAATGYLAYLALLRPGTLSVGDVLMYSRAFASGVSTFQMMLAEIGLVNEDLIFLQDLAMFHNVLRESQQQNLPTGEIRKRVIPHDVYLLEFKDVCFTYPGCQKPVLRNLNLKLNKGESCLLTGANGSGKTTLIKLLLRLYEPTHGCILLNGVDIRQYEVETLRKEIGVIFQSSLALALSARENIGVGCVDAVNNMQRIRMAAQRARADAFIDQLPEQYDTCLSRLFDGGAELSGGQWRRVGLARLFAKDSSVFVLDEPTVNIDLETEGHVLREIAALAHDRVCLLISHRLLREEITDRIVVLEGGRITEDGSYRQLLGSRGTFARLHALHESLYEIGA